MTALHVKTCQRCHRPTKGWVTILRGHPSPVGEERIAEICPLCYVQLLAWLHETLEVVKAHDLPR